MDVSIRGRGVGVTDRFENYVGSKTEKVEHLLPKAQAFEVKVSRLSDRSPSNGDRVEITLIGPGPVIRAESTGNDKYTAFDIAYGRVLERIRRLKDRRHDRRGKGRTSLGEAAAEDFSVVDIAPAPLETIEAVSTGAVPVIAEAWNPFRYETGQSERPALTPKGGTMSHIRNSWSASGNAWRPCRNHQQYYHLKTMNYRSLMATNVS